MLTDIRLALRALSKRPGFTATAVLTLSLGIAATSAIFTLVNAILLRPLPYRAPAQLVSVSDTYQGEDNAVGYSNYRDWRRDNTVFQEMALWEGTTDILDAGQGESLRVKGVDVTASFFRLLGVEPAQGRGFLESEEHQGTGVPAIVLTHDLWQRLYAGRSDLVGRTITFNNRQVAVVGIMPRGFWFGANGPAEFFVPMRWTGSGRGQHQYDAGARLKPGVTLAAAQAQMSQIAARIEAAYPEATGWGIHLTGMAEAVAEPIRAPLAMLSAAVGLLLLVACANLGSLLLVRATSRARDIAVRAALGAGRRHVIRELLAEALVIGAAGAGLGGVLGVAAVRKLAAAAPAQMQLPMPTRVDGTVVGFCIGVSLLTMIVASLLPVWRSSRTDLVQALHSGPGMRGRSHQRLLQVSVVGQIALAALLLVAGGLLVSSLVAMQRANLGFDPRGVLTLEVQHLGDRVTRDEARRFDEALLERVRAIPGVQAVAATWSLPLSNMYSGSGFSIEGRPAPAEWRLMSAQNQVVSPTFFSTLGIRVLEGRVFDEHDRADARPVVVINRSLARRHWAGQSAVGARIRYTNESQTALTVIGVVDDVYHNGPGRAAPPAIYRAMAQSPMGDCALAIRAASEDRRALVTAIRKEVRALDAAGVVTRVQTLEDALGANLTLPRLIASCMTAFALVALLLAAIGLYGAIAQWVAQRRHEVGVRLALGATRGQVAALVLSRGLTLSAAGLAAGFALALGVTELMRSLLFGITPTDVRTFVGVALLLFVAATVACLAPARRAAGVDPIVTLKAE